MNQLGLETIVSKIKGEMWMAWVGQWGRADGARVSQSEMGVGLNGIG